MIIYGRNAVTEALRGQRRVRRIWAVKGDWSGAPVTQASPADITARCGSDAHQGVCADVEEYRYANAAELLARPEPFLVALDEVTDPQNLGAVCRTAEVAGATGVILPERRSAEVTPAVCKASAGAVEHLAIAQVRNLADFLRDAKAAECWVYGADAGRAHPVSRPGLPRRGRPGARRGGQRPQAEGEGCGATTSSHCPSAGASTRSTSALPRRFLCTRSCSNGLTPPHNRVTLPESSR